MKIAKESRKTAECLLKLGAVKISDTPFLWASGIESPIYCDNRIIYSHVYERELILKAFIQLINDEFSEIEMIVGVATGGIPMGVLIADRLKLPFCYVRQEAKAHGMQQQMEGEYHPGQRTLVIEDLISSGASSFKAIEGVRRAELKTCGLISIMNYGFPKAARLFDAEKIDVYSLCNVDNIIQVGLMQGYITDEQKDKILFFKDKVGS